MVKPFFAKQHRLQTISCFIMFINSIPDTVLHKSIYLISIQICTVSFYRMSSSIRFSKGGSRVFGLRMPHRWPLDWLALLQTVLILNKCTTFVPLKTGACRPVSRRRCLYPRSPLTTRWLPKNQDLKTIISVVIIIIMTIIIRPSIIVSFVIFHLSVTGK